MGGFFGVISEQDCVSDLFYGTDYHSHLGTMRAGLAVKGDDGMTRIIHDITNAQFRSKFEGELPRMAGTRGIGVISDYEDQPLLIGSHLGPYAIVTVGAVRNAEELVAQAFAKSRTHFSEMSGTEINPTELVASLIDREDSFVEGIAAAQDAIEGSCSLLLLTEDGIYAARDKLGRTPVVTGKKDGSCAVTLETTAFANLDYKINRWLGPGEIVRITRDGVESLRPPGDRMQICAFLWVYYGFPASSYEGINVEMVRNRCGEALARADDVTADLVAGIPDSGTAHALGYANEANLPFRRPFVKYTPTWPRSFLPHDHRIRELVARMKLIPVEDLIAGKRLLFCEDSIVRGTQLGDTFKRLYGTGAKEIHMRVACPPLLYACKFLNFSRSRSELELATRRAIQLIEGYGRNVPPEYADPESDRYAEMVEKIRERLDATTLRYQRLPDLIEAIGLPKETLCTYCWEGECGDVR